jgi:hypothetical protein
MNRERDETDLRVALAPLRRRDEALPRPFAMMWSAAERHVAAGRHSGRSYRWIAAGSLAALILAVALVETSERHALEVSSHIAPDFLVDAVPQLDKAGAGWMYGVPSYVDPLSAWRSPTDFLLASDPELWRSTPRFGPSADYSITFPGQEI